MIRNLKALGLALVAVLAMGAMTAVAAQADEFHSESAPVTFEGSQTEQHTFDTDAGTVQCETAAFKGSNATTTSTTATLSATYTGCDAFGFINATVDMNSCNYVFHLTGTLTAQVQVECSGGEEIEVSVPFTGCVAKIPAQSELGHVTFTNTGSGTTRDIDANINVTGIDYSLNSNCSGGPGSFSNGVYEGTATIKGFAGKKQQGIWIA